MEEEIVQKPKRPYIIGLGLFIVVVVIGITIFIIKDKKNKLSPNDTTDVTSSASSTSSSQDSSTSASSVENSTSSSSTNTSTPAQILTNCAVYGGSTAANTCPAGQELYAGLCYNKCTGAGKRTAVCTCAGGSVQTNCNLYGSSSVPNYACNQTGYSDYWGGLCYTDACKNQGGTRTAALSCDFGSLSVLTDCSKYSSVEGKSCPNGYSRSAVCSCTRGGVVTNSVYGASVLPSYACPSGTDSFAGLCYKQQCPAGYKRTAACSCSNEYTDTNCATNGSPGSLPTCPPGSQLFAGICYTQSCPSGYKRTAACSCSKIN